MPLQVTFSTGASISYLYDMAGTKRQTVHRSSSGSTTTTDYCGSVVYENGVQKSLLTQEGYLNLANSTYYYFVKDHLGNNRVVVNQSGAVQQATHYYPFGAIFADGTGADVQRYKYNGKELDSGNELNLYDYGARIYDPVLANWSTVDPMAEKHYSSSPYLYCLNNPVMYIDPLGQDTISINDQTGRMMSHDKVEGGDDIIFLVDNNGVRQKSLKLSEGAIVRTRRQDTQYKDPHGKIHKGSTDIYEIRGDENSDAFFDFLADHFTVSNKNEVEFNLFQTGEAGEKGLAFLTTSGFPGGDPGGPDLWRGQLYGGYSIRSHTHNHPGGTKRITGEYDAPDGTPAGKWGDVGFKNSVRDWYTQKYPHRRAPAFYIKVPGDKTRIQY